MYHNIPMRPITSLLPALVLLSKVAAPALAAADPAAGDVFREYAWAPEGKLHVLSLKQTPIAFPGAVDLEAATRAELVFEIGNAHLGYEDMAVRWNEGPWAPLPFPGVAPSTSPSPSLYFHQWWPVVPVALTDLRERDNRFELRIGPHTFDKGDKHPAWTPVYGIVLRVYYDPARKPHGTGRLLAPRAGATVGRVVALQASASLPAGRTVAAIQFVGEYEDVSREGDGQYRRWHYTYHRGALAEHLGTATRARERVSWDTSWVPDQPEPMRLLARVVDDTGLTVLTPVVAGVKLVRPGFSVELARPYDVPPGFTSCQYGVYIHQGPRVEKFDVKGDVRKLRDARFFESCWNCPSGNGFTVNDVPLEQAVPSGEGGTWMHVFAPLRPLAAIKSGTNTLATVPAPKRASDVHLPGIAVLLQYDTRR